MIEKKIKSFMGAIKEIFPDLEVQTKKIGENSHVSYYQLDLNRFTYFTFDLRPQYCDRGRYMVYLDSKYADGNIYHDDENGMFPRIYFEAETMTIELVRWIEVRRKSTPIPIDDILKHFS